MTEHISIKVLDDEPAVLITLPGNTGSKDLDRIASEIQAAMEQAYRRGEQDALAKIAAMGGE